MLSSIEEEFTVELETRPMVAFEPDVLDKLHNEVIDGTLCDPVFSLDESKGSILAVFQVWAATAAIAAALGCWMFLSVMVKSGFDRDTAAIEMISVTKTSEDDSWVKVKVQSPKEKLNT